MSYEPGDEDMDQDWPDEPERALSQHDKAALERAKDLCWECTGSGGSGLDYCKVCRGTGSLKEGRAIDLRNALRDIASVKP